MGLPGVVINVLDGSLSLQPGSNEQVVLYLGCSLSGAVDSIGFYSDSSTAQTALTGGELLEQAAYSIEVGGGPVGVMPLPPTTQGGVSAVTHVGTGAGTVTLSLAPHVGITLSCTTAGALGSAAFTYQLGSGAVSAPVLSNASWDSTGWRVPGTYCNVVFASGSYTNTDVYTISTLGVVAHPTGSGPAVPTFTASPVDYYEPRITIGTGGALGTMQFTYALDYGVDNATSNTSASVLSPGGGVYAIPNTGVVLTFAGTFVAGDTYDFVCAGPTFTGTDLAAALTALETTLLAQATYAMLAPVGSIASASAWTTQAAALEAAADGAFFTSGVYVRCFSGCPTVGTVLPNAGSVTIDSADTDSVVIAARQSWNNPRVVPCAGDAKLLSAVSGLTFRRNALWTASARASAVVASQDIGAVEDGSLTGVTGIYRDENATQGFYAAGITCLRTFSGSGAQGFYITKGLTGAQSTSDYYPLTNARVIDRACGISRLEALPLVNSKIRTTTRNGQAGVIAESDAQRIEGIIDGALETDMVDTVPADAVAASVLVSRTHNILADGDLIIAVSVQPFAYATTVTVNIGLTVSA